MSDAKPPGGPGRRLAPRRRRWVGTAPGRAFLGSLLLHAVLVAIAIMVARGVAAETEEVDEEPVRLSFVDALPEVAPSGGGGGGGEEVLPAEPEVVEAPPVPEPVAPPRERRERRDRDDQVESRDLVEPTPEREPALEPEVDETENAEDLEPAPPTDSTTPTGPSGEGSGSGTGGGTGGGTGSGDGPGTGSGTGAGTGSGAGGGTNDTPVYFRAGMERPRLLAGQHPRYTRQAQRAGVEGSVVVRILIGRDGRVRDVDVLTSIPLLDDEVVRTVSRWRYTPPVVQGRAVSMYMIQRIRFDR